jgi:hypothetical protein
MKVLLRMILVGDMEDKLKKTVIIILVILNMENTMAMVLYIIKMEK